MCPLTFLAVIAVARALGTAIKSEFIGRRFGSPARAQDWHGARQCLNCHRASETEHGLLIRFWKLALFALGHEIS